ncbi:MAG: IS3 family transposase [Thermoleophilia bacterium]
MVHLVECHKIKYGLNRCLAALGLAKSSYYWQKKQPTLAEKYEDLRAEVLAVIAEHPAYGYRRIEKALRARGRVVNHKCLRRLLRVWGLAMIRKTKKSRPSGIVRLLGELGGVVNLAQAGGKLFGLIRSDFTEISYTRGKVYLAAALDDKSRKALGWQVAGSANKELVLKVAGEALRALTAAGADVAGAIFHQDQGSVYTSYAYVDKLLKAGARLSYSRAGKPGDNAMIESFFGRLKEEWGPTFTQAETEQEVIELINQAMESYNRDRLHSSLDYQSPNAYINNITKQEQQLTHSFSMA